MWAFVYIVSFLFFVVSSSSQHLQRNSKTIQERGGGEEERRRSCPLGMNGPNQNQNFFLETELLDFDLPLDHSCSSFGLQYLSPTCCKAKYLDDLEEKGKEKDPFTTSATEVLVKISSSCTKKLSSFTCGVCRQYQHSFVQNYSSFSELRLCLSFCENLLMACDGDVVRVPGDTIDSIAHDSYGTDAARFCTDLFANVENVKVTISTDVSTNGDLSDWSSLCFSDAEECEENDFEAFYTECDGENDSRSVYYKYKKDTKCRGGKPLPPPIKNLPCHQTCPSGYYLPIGTTECSPCLPGTQSISGYYIDKWADWPTDMDFTTYCELNDGYSPDPIEVIKSCEGWKLNDTFVESGEEIRNKQNSVLETTFYMVRNGYIGFEYKVFAEQGYDGLFFFIDGEEVMSLKSEILDWEYVQFDLSSGMHTAKWVFYKDYIGTDGFDMALINKIFVVGTKWADSKCEPCPPGHYSNKGAEICPKCSLNTYSDGTGFPKCEPCPESQYSYIGADHCLERLPCTAADTITHFTPCEDNSRDKWTEFNSPILCDTTKYELVNTSGLPCADCNPGFYRPEGENLCRFCEPGYYSESVGATECTLCDAGSIAPKALSYTQFDNWEELIGMSTHCVGDCASDGWRLLSDEIDSGVGHGTIVDVSLFLNFHLEEVGILEFHFTLECTHYCISRLTEVSKYGLIYQWRKQGYTGKGPEKFQTYFPPGNHTIQWMFSKVDSDVRDSPFDRFIIHDIVIHGAVKEGGATSCLTCPPGFYSDKGAESCSECPPGFFSHWGDGECTPCEDGTYSDEPKTTSCKECPQGSQSTEDRTGCFHNDCTYSPAPGVEYNLSALEVTLSDDIYGPVVDQAAHQFFLSPCGRQASLGTCWNNQGIPFLTHACQYLPPPYNYTADLGPMQGYYPLEDESLADDPLRSGLVMTFTQGTPGCASRSSPPYPRSTNITFVCNPNAGIGFPVAVEPVEDPPCRYNFRWASAYACPLCTMEHYNVFYGSCVENKQTKSYAPKNYPNRCTGGTFATTPAPEEIACEISNVECPPGYYLPVGAAEVNGCAPARPGYFSIGGGFIFDQFESYETFQPPVFETGGTWLLLGDLMRSGGGDTAFSINVFLLKPGEVRFSYKVYAPLLDDDESGFRFFINGFDALTSSSTNYSFSESNFSLPSGAQKLQWRFTGGSLPSKSERGNYAMIDYIHITGVTLAARSDTPCRGGTFQPQSGQTSCELCGENTRSSMGSERCVDCDDASYSFPGSDICEPRKRCEGRDFVLRYTECVNKSRTQYHKFLEPQICVLDRTPFETNITTGVDCAVCRPGYFSDPKGDCQPCGLGSYYETSTKHCITSPPGSVALLTHTYFPTAKSEDESRRRGVVFRQDGPGELPEGFSTVSTTPHDMAWRVLNDTLESGYHSVIEADSILTLNVTLLHQGAIDFWYTLAPLREEEEEDEEDFQLNGLQFFINGEAQSDNNELKYHPDLGSWQNPMFKLEFPGESANFSFEWIYHQPAGSRQRNRIVLSDIRILGDSRGTAFETRQCLRGSYSAGGSTSCSPCGPGTYADQNGMESCLMCPDQTFTNKYGSVDCEQCGEGTNSSEDKSFCDISECQFWDGENQRHLLNESAQWNLAYLNQHIKIKGNEDFRYELSICNKVPEGSSSCFSADNVLLDTFSCAINRTNGVAQDYGRIANVNYTNEEGEEPSIHLRYNKGHICGNNSYAYTDVTFICDMNMTDPNWGLTLISSDDCATTIEWRNYGACRVCEFERGDYLKQNTECEKNIKTVSYVKIVDCFGPPVLTSQSKGCSGTYPLTLPIVLSSLGAFLILLLIIFVVALRNKKLAEQYETLVNETTSQRESGWERDSAKL